MATDFDVQVGDYKFHLLRGMSDTYGPSYQLSHLRNQVQTQQALSGKPTLQSRGDIAFMDQTDWSEGSAWWLPLITGEDMASYHHAKGIDAWSRPGAIVPLPQPEKITPSIAPTDGTGLCNADGTIFVVANTKLINASYYDIIKWDSATEDLVTTTWHSNISADPYGMVYEPNNAIVVTLGSGRIGYFDPAVATTVNHMLTGVNGKEGSALLVHNDLIFVYNGDTLRYVSDPTGTPAWVDVFDDGMGYDWLADSVGGTSGARIVSNRNINLALSTPEGIFYVKNIDDGGLPTPWVYRVEKAVDGTWVGYPITVLPRGTVALDINIHLGSLIISTVRDWEALKDNDVDDNLEVTYYHVTDGNIGTIGKPLGYNETYGLYDTPASILGSWGSELYLAGRYSLWVYDAVRGGIHQLGYFTDPTGGTTVGDLPSAWTLTTDSLDEIIHLVLIDGELWMVNTTPTTGLTTGFIESNWFDFGIPYEDKTVYKATLHTDEMQADVVWQFWILSEDETVWRLMGQTEAGKYHEIPFAIPQTAKMFRYRLSYGDVTPDLPDTSGSISTGSTYNFSTSGTQTVGLASHGIGDMVMVQVLTDNTNTVTMPSGWTLAGSDTTFDRHYVYYKYMTSVEPTIDVELSASAETFITSIAVADWGTEGVVPETVRNESAAALAVTTDVYTDAEIDSGYELWVFGGSVGGASAFSQTNVQGAALTEVYNREDQDSGGTAGVVAFMRNPSADGSNQEHTLTTT